MQNGHLVTETSSDHLRTRAEALVASLRSRGVIGSETRPFMNEALVDGVRVGEISVTAGEGGLWVRHFNVASQGQGHGGAFMRQLLEAAEEARVPVALEAHWRPWEGGGRIARFWMRLGFAPQGLCDEDRMEMKRDHLDGLTAFLSSAIGSSIDDLCLRVRDGEARNVLAAAAIAARESGLAATGPNTAGHDVHGVDAWDRFVLTGEEDPHDLHLSPLAGHVAEAIRNWSYDPEGKVAKRRPDLPVLVALTVLRRLDPSVPERVRVLAAEHVRPLRDMIRSQIAMPVPNLTERSMSEHPSGHDGGMVCMKMDGWRPTLMRVAPGDVSLSAIPALPERPVAACATLPAGGLVILCDNYSFLSGRLRDLEKNHAKFRSGGVGIGSDLGLAGWRSRMLALTGGVCVQLGDRYPVMTMSGPDVVLTSNGPDSDVTLEDPVIMGLEDYAALAFGAGADVDAVRAWLETPEAANEGHHFVMTDAPTHVIFPNLWDVEAFSLAVLDVGICGDDASVCAVMTARDPGFPEGVMTRIVAADTPRMVFDDACPGAPDIATSRPEM